MLILITLSASIAKLQLKTEMGSGRGPCSWSIFDGVKTIPATPEALIEETDAAIAAFEYAQATALLSAPSSSSDSRRNRRSSDSGSNPKCRYDVGVADEAYRAGCSALAAGKLDEALHHLNNSHSKCPPHKTSAIAKLQSLITLTSQQLQRSQK